MGALFRGLTVVHDRRWLRNPAAYEYQQHRLGVVSQQISGYEAAKQRFRQTAEGSRQRLVKHQGHDKLLRPVTRAVKNVERALDRVCADHI